MKKCVYCGCINNTKRTVCADCGRTLANSVKANETEFNDMLDDLSEYSDPFSFKPRYKVVFYAGLSLIVVNVVLMFLSLINPLMAFISIIFLILCTIISRFSEIIWGIEKFFLQFKVSGDIDPSEWWYINREISIFLCFIIGIITFLYGLVSNSPPITNVYTPVF